MTRVVSVFLPTFPTDRFRRRSPDALPPADQPLVLVGSDGRRRVVLAADQAAQQAGLRVGMPATKAQVLVPGLAKVDADPHGDADALERLAFWALRYSPVVMADHPDGFVIDIDGADHLIGGEDALLRDVVERMQQAGFAVRAAVADHWGTAHALARFGGAEAVIIHAGECRHAISPLPLACLRLDPNIVASLTALGFETVGDLLANVRSSSRQSGIISRTREMQNDVEIAAWLKDRHSRLRIIAASIRSRSAFIFRTGLSRRQEIKISNDKRVWNNG